MPFAAPLALLGLVFVPLVVAFWMLEAPAHGADGELHAPLAALRRGPPGERARGSGCGARSCCSSSSCSWSCSRSSPPSRSRSGRRPSPATSSSSSTHRRAWRPPTWPRRAWRRRRQARPRGAARPAGRRPGERRRRGRDAAGRRQRDGRPGARPHGRSRRSRATPATADMGEALALASALAARAGDAQVLVATDAAFTPAGRAWRWRRPSRSSQVGRERKNQAIVAFAVRSSPTAVTRSVFISVANLGPRADHRAGGAVGRRPAPGGARPVPRPGQPGRRRRSTTFPSTSASSRPASRATDQLALDDRAWAVVPPDRLLRILLVSDGDPYLETALSFLPNAELYGVKPADYGPGTKPELFDLVIFDAALPATLPRVPTLAIAPPRTSPLGTVTGTLGDPALGRPAPDEPLLRYVDLTTLHVAQATPAVAARLGAHRRPHRGRRSAPLHRRRATASRPASSPSSRGAPTCRSRWPSRSSSATWSASSSGASRAPTTAVAPGTLVSLPIPVGATGLRVTRPDGTTLDLAPSRSRRARRRPSPPPSSSGVYTVAPLGLAGAGPGPGESPAAPRPAARRPRPRRRRPPLAVAVAPRRRPAAPVQFAVDLFDVDESTIAPGSAAALERLGSDGHRRARRRRGDRPPARDDLWIPLAAIALAFLVLEAFVFQRDALVRRIRRRLGRGRPAARRRRRGPGRAGPLGPGAPPDGRQPRPRRSCSCSSRSWSGSSSGSSSWRTAGSATPGRGWRSSSAPLLVSALVMALAGRRRRPPGRPAGHGLRRRPLRLRRQRRPGRGPGLRPRGPRGATGRGPRGCRGLRDAMPSWSGCPTS